MTQPNATDEATFTTGDHLRARAIGFRTAANDLYTMMNALTSSGNIPRGSEVKLLGYFLSVTVLRALSAECMLKAMAFVRSGSFEREHNLSRLYDALDGDTRGFIERLADSYGVASPKRVLNRHRNDFVEWRYPVGQPQTTGLLDLDTGSPGAR